MKSTTMLMLASLAGICFFSGCEKKGSMEKAGEKMDKAVDKMQQKVEEAGKDIRKSVNE